MHGGNQILPLRVLGKERKEKKDGNRQSGAAMVQCSTGGIQREITLKICLEAIRIFLLPHGTQEYSQGLLVCLCKPGCPPDHLRTGLFLWHSGVGAHERANLQIHENGPIVGDDAAHSRLASVFQKAVRLYAVGAVLMATVLLPVAIHFFKMHHQTGIHDEWPMLWIAVVSATHSPSRWSPSLLFSLVPEKTTFLDA